MAFGILSTAEREAVGTAPTRAQANTKGSDFCVGDIVQGFGLHNAGRYYTVKAIGTRNAARVELVRHLDGHRFWAFASSYRFIGQMGD
jgi:hypothetical protein